MPNIIINNYCNQKCPYCFASENMKNKTLQKNMDIKTYLTILKYLKLNNNNEVRILGGEPLLFPNISNFIKIATKGGFNITIFSNINIKNTQIIKIFKKNIKNIRINCNINNKLFYSKNEIKRIEKNLDIFNNLGIKIILGYNIININTKPDFILELAKKHNIKALNLKITNTEAGKKIIIDNSKKNLGIYIYNFIKENYKDYFIEISCGLDKKIFSKNQLDFIKNIAKVNLNFGCEGNIGKFDINVDGSIFKCFPLKKFFTKSISIKDLLKNKIKIRSVIKKINYGFYNKGTCYSYKH